MSAAWWSAVLDLWGWLGGFHVSYFCWWWGHKPYLPENTVSLVAEQTWPTQRKKSSEQIHCNGIPLRETLVRVNMDALWYLSSVPHMLVCYKVFFIVGTRRRIVTHTQHTRRFQKCLEPSRHSPKKGCLRCQVINLASQRGLKPERWHPEAEGMPVLACVPWFLVSRNPCQLVSTNCRRNQDPPGRSVSQPSGPGLQVKKKY